MTTIQDPEPITQSVAELATYVMPVSKDDIVRVRARKYLVDDVVPPNHQGEATLVRLACLEDDAQGEPLEVLWEKELDARKESDDFMAGIKRFDAPPLFAAYLHALRWNCVTSTNPKLFQAPYRAGIQVKAYQLEPLSKALQLPRVNLFIADDVGLGKTIEAGLILRELLMRQRVHRTVIACPPSVVRQWKDEMEQRFGLTFTIYDRAFVGRCRRERGYGINPWTTHNRFIISQALLRNEDYAGPLQAWLDNRRDGSLLILDEAHNAAPASGARYAFDSKFTKKVRDLVPLFEHKLFLSATPHNGHSNSFTALLELLDPQRFCRGVPIKQANQLEPVMVRRLKDDLRHLGEDFPKRNVIKVDIKNLPENAPELRLSILLQKYRVLREQRHRSASRKSRAAAMLVVNSLQKRLLSSIDAFASTLKVHTDSVATEDTRHQATSQQYLLFGGPDMDDEHAEWSERELAKAEAAQIRAASRRIAGTPPVSPEEHVLLAEMKTIASSARHESDPRILWFRDWIRDHCCPDLGQTGAKWNKRRLLIFTEFVDTKNYLKKQLDGVIANSDCEGRRIDEFYGGIGEERREKIKADFNADPSDNPLRILIATDAAREGVNLQNHCYDLFHFDVPWNPSRMEQRNGRIDRKLQRADEVFCHYFVFAQRVEDRVLETLVRKTNTILAEVGSMSPVLQGQLAGLLDGGIRHDNEDLMKNSIEEGGQQLKQKTEQVSRELEVMRQRQKKLSGNLDNLRGLLEKSHEWLNLKEESFRAAVSTSLELLGSEGLIPLPTEKGKDAQWQVPNLARATNADPSWNHTLDSLRPPRGKDQQLFDWRRETKIRPVVFRDPVIRARLTTRSSTCTWNTASCSGF